MTTHEARLTSDDIRGQKLPFPAKQSEMNQQPDSDMSNYRAAGKLRGKVALITGGDSGIGRAVAVAFAMEGANVAIGYKENDGDAFETRAMVEKKGQFCELIRCDVRSFQQCKV